MMIRAHMSSRLRTVESRIGELKKMAEPLMMSSAKKHAVGVVREFRNGIENNDFGFEPLHPGTVRHKESKGYANPEAPLHGAGKSQDPKSYSRMLRIRKLKAGWKVYPSWAKHHESDLQLRHLLMIQEYGVTIDVTPRMRNFLHSIGIHLKTSTTSIRIPPRPAFFYAYRRYMQKAAVKSDSSEMAKAVAEYINEARMQLINQILRSDKKEEFED